VKTLSDADILYGIRHRDNDVLEYIYKRFFPSVHKIVKERGGDEHDARDLFQDAVVILFKNIRNGKIRIKGSFPAYFLVMCRFLWYEARDADPSTRETLLDQLGESQLESLAETPADTEEKRSAIRNDFDLRKEKIYQKHYRYLTTDCKKVLTMFYRKRGYEHIAHKMGYSSAGYARRKKYLCWRHLLKRIKDDKEFKRMVKEKRGEDL